RWNSIVACRPHPSSGMKHRDAQAAWGKRARNVVALKSTLGNERHRFAWESSLRGTWPSTIALPIIVPFAQLAATGCKSLVWFLGAITFGNRWFFNAIAVTLP